MQHVTLDEARQAKQNQLEHRSLADTTDPARNKSSADGRLTYVFFFQFHLFKVKMDNKCFGTLYRWLKPRRSLTIWGDYKVTEMAPRFIPSMRRQGGRIPELSLSPSELEYQPSSTDLLKDQPSVSELLAHQPDEFQDQPGISELLAHQPGLAELIKNQPTPGDLLQNII